MRSTLVSASRYAGKAPCREDFPNIVGERPSRYQDREMIELVLPGKRVRDGREIQDGSALANPLGHT